MGRSRNDRNKDKYKGSYSQSDASKQAVLEKKGIKGTRKRVNQEEIDDSIEFDFMLNGQPMKVDDDGVFEAVIPTVTKEPEPTVTKEPSSPTEQEPTVNTQELKPTEQEPEVDIQEPKPAPTIDTQEPTPVVESITKTEVETPANTEQESEPIATVVIKQQTDTRNIETALMEQYKKQKPPRESKTNVINLQIKEQAIKTRISEAMEQTHMVDKYDKLSQLISDNKMLKLKQETPGKTILHRSKQSKVLNSLIARSKRFRNISDVVPNKTEEVLYGKLQCWCDVIQDYLDTKSKWLFRWLTSTDFDKIDAIDLAEDDSLNVNTKCMLDLIAYVSVILYEEGNCDINKILGANGLYLNSYNITEDSQVYSITANNKDSLDFSSLKEVCKRLTYLYMCKKYRKDTTSSRNYDEIKDNLPTVSEQSLREAKKIINTDSVCFLTLPKYFHTRFEEHRTEYRYLNTTSKCNFLIFLDTASKSISEALYFVKETTKDSTVFDTYYKDELDIIYRYIYNLIVTKDKQIVKKLIEDISTEYIKSGKTLNYIPNTTKLPDTDEGKILYMRCLANLLTS